MQSETPGNSKATPPTEAIGYPAVNDAGDDDDGLPFPMDPVNEVEDGTDGDTEPETEVLQVGDGFWSRSNTLSRSSTPNLLRQTPCATRRSSKPWPSTIEPRLRQMPHGMDYYRKWVDEQAYILRNGNLDGYVPERTGNEYHDRDTQFPCDD